MLEIAEVFGKIYSSIELTMKEAGMTPVIPEGTQKGQVPLGKMEDGVGDRLEYRSEAGAVRIEYLGSRITLSISTTTDGEGSFTDFGKVSTSLLDLETADDIDVKYISGEISDTVMAKFCKPTAVAKAKAPKTVSKAAARSGSVYFDSNTLAKRLTVTLYPEFRYAYEANIAKYGEFLAEDFFAQGCTKAIIETIRQNDPAKMKKLFTLLNEIYVDATNETQSLIAVTILGEICNDQVLLANCTDYMCDDMMGPVIRVNKYLATGKGKKAMEKLKNPPPYKPKKAKKPSLMERLAGGQQRK